MKKTRLKQFTFNDPACSKIPYCSEHSAKKALKKQQNYGASVLRVYRCEIRECRKFHLTSQLSDKGY